MTGTRDRLLLALSDFDTKKPNAPMTNFPFHKNFQVRGPPKAHNKAYPSSYLYARLVSCKLSMYSLKELVSLFSLQAPRLHIPDHITRLREPVFMFYHGHQPLSVLSLYVGVYRSLDHISFAPEPTGNYRTATTAMKLVDSTRPDPSRRALNFVRSWSQYSTRSAPLQHATLVA